MNVLMGVQRAVRNFPDSPAIIDGEVRLNWREFGERNRKLGTGLKKLGLGKGDSVSVLMLNGFRYLEMYFGLPGVGAVVVPINYRFSPAEIAYVINDSQSVALVVDDAFAAVVDKIRPDLKTVKHFIFAGKGEMPAGMMAYESLLEDEADFEPVAAQEDDIVGLFYTGGTTGNSKGVILTHKNLASNALHIGIHLQYQQQHNYLHAGPMFHLADGASTFAVTNVGACHTFVSMFDVAKTLEVIQRERVTHTLLVPTMINAVVNSPALKDYDLSSWQILLYGASPMPVEVLKKAMQVLPCKLMQAYGMTEASPLLTVLPWEVHVKGVEAVPGTAEARRLMSCGQPCVGVEVRIVDEQGKQVAPGEIGEVVARGPNIMKGYWNLAEETSYGLRGGWLHTGDLATLDDQNFYFIVDRKKDMIISGGENIYSVEVENAIYAHPAVLEAAVVGVPDEKWGERVHAIVVLKPGQQATGEEIMQKCRDLIAGYKLPRSVEFTDVLPKSGAGKILKRNLRDKYWEGQTRQVH